MIEQRAPNAERSLTLKVIKVKQPIGDFYIASVPARDLVDISYVDIRRIKTVQRDVERYLGVQRPLSPARVKKIKQYITASDATFPTAVILAVDERCVEYDAEAGHLMLSEYVPEEDSEDTEISYNRIAKVLDGQHRISGFIDENGNYEFEFDDRDFDLNVAIFVGADISEQANIFATVNLAQTKVNRSLVYDLTELARSRSPYKTCHEIAVALDSFENGPFYKRIKRLGVATPGRKFEPLTQASFVESLVRFISADPRQDRDDLLEGRKLKYPDSSILSKHPFRGMFIRERDIDITEIIHNYFSAIREKWPRSWEAIDKKGNLLPRSNAFKAFMRYLKDDVYLNIAGSDIGRIPEINEFAPYLRNMSLTDEDFTTRNFAPGSGGQSTFLKLLRGQITAKELLED